MKKRLLSILTAILLLANLIPLNVLATQTVILDNITNKSPGQQVTIKGTTTLEGATIQVKRPNGTILYIDMIEGESFISTFTLPDVTPTGTYEVVVGKGSTYSKKTFEVNRKDDGNTSNNNSSTKRPKPSKPHKPKVESNDDGSVNVRVNAKRDGKHAKVVLDSTMMDKAYDQSKKDKKGFKTVVVEVTDEADEYAIELPSDVVLSDTANKRTRLKTPLGSITLQNNMFTSYDVKGEDNVTLTLGFADQSSIKKETMDKIGDKPIIEVHAKLGDKTVSWNNPNAPVEIAINYEPTAEELKNPEHIVVWYINNQGKVVSIPNGKYDLETGKVVFTTTHFSKYAVAFVNKTFSDIENYSWAKKEIEVMASKGVISGTSSTTYSPQKSITRADFMCLLVRTLKLDAEFISNFDDVKSIDYYYEALGIAKELGITVGIGNNKYNPEGEISRQDMMVLVARALKIVGKSTITETDIEGFNDIKEVSSYAVEGVAILIKEGIIQGSENNIYPKNAATRAETAVMMYRVLNK